MMVPALYFFCFFSTCTALGAKLKITTSYDVFPVVGENATFMCTYSPNNPNADGQGIIAWRRDDVSLVAFQCKSLSEPCIERVIPDYSKYHMEINGIFNAKFTIFNLTMTDSGTYKCKVVDTEGPTTKQIELLIRPSGLSDLCFLTFKY